MTYFELLEQDTNNPEIQFALYKACLAGEDEGTDNAETWLKAAAENGHEEAIKILNEQKDSEANADNSDNEYSKMSLRKLHALSASDYNAAKELYVRKKNDLTFNEKINLLNKITKFDVSQVEDFEQLIALQYEHFVSFYTINTTKKPDFDNFFEACDNAIELGSNYARKKKICLILNLIPTNREKYLPDLISEYGRRGDFYDKVYALILFKLNKKVICNDSTIRAAVIEEEIADELENHKELKDAINKKVNIVQENKILNLEPSEDSLAIAYCYMLKRNSFVGNQWNPNIFKMIEKFALDEEGFIDYLSCLRYHTDNLPLAKAEKEKESNEEKNRNEQLLAKKEKENEEKPASSSSKNGKKPANGHSAGFCPFCGNPLRESAQFCAYCGKECKKKSEKQNQVLPLPSQVTAAPAESKLKINKTLLIVIAGVVLAILIGIAGISIINSISKKTNSKSTVNSSVATNEKKKDELDLSNYFTAKTVGAQTMCRIDLSLKETAKRFKYKNYIIEGKLLRFTNDSNNDDVLTFAVYDENDDLVSTLIVRRDTKIKKSAWVPQKEDENNNLHNWYDLKNGDKYNITVVDSKGTAQFAFKKSFTFFASGLGKIANEHSNFNEKSINGFKKTTDEIVLPNSNELENTKFEGIYLLYNNTNPKKTPSKMVAVYEYNLVGWLSYHFEYILNPVIDKKGNLLSEQKESRENDYIQSYSYVCSNGETLLRALHESGFTFEDYKKLK